MKKSKSQVETLKDQIASLEQQTAERRAKVDTLGAERSALIRSSGTDAAIDEKEQEIEGAIKVVARSEERLAALRENLAAAEAAAADAAQGVLVEKANRVAQDAANGWHALWRDMTPKLRAALRAQAEADALVEQVNKARRPADALLSTEQRLRHRPALKAQVLSEKRVSRWCFTETGNRIPDDKLENIEPMTASTGKFFSTGAGTPHDVDVREFIERRSLPARAKTSYIRPLASSVCIPELRDGEVPGWKPLDGNPSPAVILRALDELEARHSSVDDRKEVVEIIPLERALAEEIDGFDDDELDELDEDAA